MEIVINKCFGGFGLSPKCIEMYLKKQGKEAFFYKRDYQSGGYNLVSSSNAHSHDTVLLKNLGETVKDIFENDDVNDVYFYYGDVKRNDPLLIEVIKNIGEEEASGAYAKLKIVEIPDGVDWEIDDYDGVETLHEKHRSW